MLSQVPNQQVANPNHSLEGLGMAMHWSQLQALSAAAIPEGEAFVSAIVNHSKSKTPRGAVQVSQKQLGEQNLLEREQQGCLDDGTRDQHREQKKKVLVCQSTAMEWQENWQKET